MGRQAYTVATTTSLSVSSVRVVEGSTSTGRSVCRGTQWRRSSILSEKTDSLVLALAEWKCAFILEQNDTIFCDLAGYLNGFLGDNVLVDGFGPLKDEVSTNSTVDNTSNVLEG